MNFVEFCVRSLTVPLYLFIELAQIYGFHIKVEIKITKVTTIKE